MRDHEIELISALVEGRLEDESEARALIASSVELQTEYEAQKRAREALAAAGPARLEENEKAVLHRDLWTALRQPPKPARAPWYFRWVPITAGLFIIVAGIAVIGGQQESANLETAGAALTSAPTTSASSAETMMDQATATTSAAAAAGDALGARAQEFETSTLGAVAQRLRDDATLEALADDGSKTTLEDCLADAGLSGYSVVRSVDPAFIAETTGSDIADVGTDVLIAAIPEGSDLKTAPITFVDSQACQVIQTED